MTQPDLLKLLNEEGFLQFANGLRAPAFAYDLDGQMIFANDELLTGLGVSREATSDIHFGSRTGSEYQLAARAAFAGAIAGEVQEYDTITTIGGGVELYLHVTLVPFRHAGDVVAVMGMALDLEPPPGDVEPQNTARKRLASTLNSISDGLFFLDHSWKFTYLNPRGEQIVARPAAELIGHSMWESFPGMYGSEFGIAYRTALTENRTVTVRDYYEELDRWLEATAHPTDDGIVVYVRDVNDEEVSRRALVESERRSAARAALLEVARDAIAVRALDHTVQFWNHAAVEIYGYTVEEAIGASIRDLLYDDPTEFDAATAAVLRDGVWSGELRHRTKDGVTVIADCSWTLTHDEAGLPESILSINTNVTERRKLEQLQLRTQRLDSLGTFASGIAHDLNNILTPVLMASQVLEMDETDTDRLLLLKSVETAASRGSALVQQILMFARGGEGRHVTVNVDELMTSVEAFARQILPKSITVTRQQDNPSWSLSCDHTEILQVLFNLISNARDAMPQGGQLSIRTRNVDVSEGPLTAANAAQPGRYVIFSVEDSGTGMTRELIDQIFDPFFTTKPVGAGTGLGLSVSAGIVRKHGGFIQVYSEPGRGSRFDVYLPAASVRASKKSRDTPAASAIAAPNGNGELILIVDDEADIRSVTRRALEAHGYHAAMASNGAEALDYLSAVPGKVRVILTDVMMPVVGGAGLLEGLADTDSTIPVVVMSGLAANRSLPMVAASAGFLAKPFTTVELLHAIHGALNTAVHGRA